MLTTFKNVKNVFCILQSDDGVLSTDLRSCDCGLPVKEVLLCDGARRNPIRGVLNCMHWRIYCTNYFPNCKMHSGMSSHRFDGVLNAGIPAPLFIVGLIMTSWIDWLFTNWQNFNFVEISWSILQLQWRIMPPETFACTRPSTSSGLSPPSWSNSRHLKALKQQVLRSGQDGVESQARCSSGHRSCVCGVRSHGPESKADPRCLPPAMRSDWQRNYFNHQLNVKERERGMTRADWTTPHLVCAIL